MSQSRIDAVVRWVLVVLGLVTTLPAFALFAPGPALATYSLAPPDDPMLLALLQHRGVLQLALGAAIV
ncbi:hypothetical protein ACFXJ8_18565 [Nonomuraea sp. NPDC059194]|uniref:hypothetical protein n=1 Tax=Nonomuraea sp. NPDC059194 TaxID=3346764 RepID=UPI003685FF49